MKITAFIVTVFLAFGASAQKYEVRLDQERLVGREPGSDVFIITKSGEKISGKEITYSPKKGRKPAEWTAIDGRQVEDSSIKIRQTKEAYWETTRYGTVYGHEVARLRKGKISLYAAYITDYMDPKHYDIDAYFFKKGDGEVTYLNHKEFENAISDNPEAVKRFNSLFPRKTLSVHYDKKMLDGLIAIVELYNK